MGPKDLAVRDNGTGCQLSVGIDDGVVANRDSTETEVAIAFDAEAADKGLVNLAVVPDMKQVMFAESREVAHLHILANVGTKEPHVKYQQRRVHSEDTPSSVTKGLVDDPPTQVICRPHRVYAWFVATNNDPFEGNGRKW